MRRLGWLIAGLVVLAACGGGGSEIDAAVPAGEVEGVVLYVHGAGETGDVTTATDKAETIQALNAAGWVVAGCDCGGDAWGNDGSIDDYLAFDEKVRDEWSTANVVIWSQSMGGIAGAELANRTDALGWMAIYPVLDLTSIAEPFASQIRMAYGDDELNRPGLPTIPTIVWASPGDSVVPFQRNGGTVPGVIVTTGDHGDPSNFDPAAVVAFVESVSSDR